MTKIGNYLFFLSLIFWGVLASAAGTTVQATVDRNEIGAGDTFTLTVAVVSSEEDVDIQDPRVPDLDGFDLLNNWTSTAVAQKLVNTGSGMQFETQRRKEFHYMLGPKRTGNLSLSAFEVVVNGKVFRTQPVVIKVAKDGAAPKPRPRPNQMPGMPGFEDPFEAMDRAEEEMFNQLLRQRQRLMQQQMPGAPDEDYPSGVNTGLPEAAFRSLPTNPNEAFFISVEVDKTEVYEGEQVTVNWYIYTRGQMETLDRLKFPSLRGFWKEIIEEVPSIQFSEEVVNGVPWKKALLASHALFPIKAGTANIDEYKIKSRVRTPAQGFGGFFGKPYEYTKSSARVPIKVKPLPVEGRPSDFTGAVGQFEVNATVEGTSVPVNQPLSLRVRFEGAGNAKLIDLPAINWPTGLEQYDTKSESKFFKNGRSFKEFEVLVIPRQEGDLTIPAISVSMFDPQTKKYTTRSTQPIQLKIVNNPNAPVGSSSRMGDPAKPAVKPKIVENRLPDPLVTWQPAVEATVLYRPWLWFLVYGGISLVLLAKAQRAFGWGRRRRSLKEMVAKRYKQVDSALNKGDFRKVGVEMTNIFYTVLGNVAGEGGAAQELETLLGKMPPSLRRDHGEEIKKNFEVFQTLSFAPEEMLGTLKDTSVMKGHVDRAKKVLNAVIAGVETKA
ncbi:BatD family protein [Bdellovibrio reynosensis]|uniref:BatD family protein n=1 Tax=Bdellovibrio reynosensis TaxID=2835041 RepID=A0ABY4CCE4_9BACT|nr:BatD family protein [Bdellovibrio reynosensis]UOF01391.1 BatD family protein [Bdellovibrio reynosensis]